jgi:hypothetical protein
MKEELSPREYGKEYYLCRDGKSIGIATWTNDPNIGDSFIAQEEHNGEIVNVVYIADYWEEKKPAIEHLFDYVIDLLYVFSKCEREENDFDILIRKISVDKETYLTMQKEDNRELYEKAFEEGYNKAKEMGFKQAQEYAEFCVHCDRNDLPLLDFEGFINLKSEG